MSDFINLSRNTEDLIKQYMPEEEVCLQMAEFFAMFSDFTRIKILSALSIAEMCVGDLAVVVGVGQSTVSHQLRILKDSKIVSTRREGKTIVYYVVNPFVNDAMITGVDHIDRLNGNYKVV